jgi:DNA-binding SARP family transcriptional activator
MPSTRPSTGVYLLDGFEVRHAGNVVSLPLVAQRLIAFLALRNRPVQRSVIVQALWPGSPSERGSGMLRSALWRVRATLPHLVDAGRASVSIAVGIHRDVSQAEHLARHVLVSRSGNHELADAEAEATLELLGGELLPGWDDDWVIVEREHLRRIGLGALEVLSTVWSAAGRGALAVEAAGLAVRSEPTRESAHARLFTALLAAGDVPAALAAYARMTAMLAGEFGLEPAPDLRRLAQDTARSRQVAAQQLSSPAG